MAFTGCSALTSLNEWGPFACAVAGGLALRGMRHSTALTGSEGSCRTVGIYVGISVASAVVRTTNGGSPSRSLRRRSLKAPDYIRAASARTGVNERASARSLRSGRDDRLSALRANAIRPYWGLREGFGLVGRQVL